MTDFALHMGLAELKLGADVRLKMVGSSASGVVIGSLSRKGKTEAQAHTKKKTAFELLHSHTPLPSACDQECSHPLASSFMQSLKLRPLSAQTAPYRL
jgi:hypothetical protein